MLNNKQLLEAIDITIANKDNQLSNEQINALIELKESALKATSIENLGKSFLIFLRILQALDFIPDDII